MAAPSRPDATTLLRNVRAGDEGSRSSLEAAIYQELRVIARRLLRGERSDHSLQPTELVHEAYLRLVDQRTAGLADRAYFFVVATTMMRRVLVDHARRQAAVKRGAAPTRVTLSEALLPGSTPTYDLLDIDASLTALESVDERCAKVACLRIFGGLKPRELAEQLGVTKRTVERDWKAARAWLIDELQSGGHARPRS